jgi:hypothetical protein
MCVYIALLYCIELNIVCLCIHGTCVRTYVCERIHVHACVHEYIRYVSVGAYVCVLRILSG